MDKQRDELEGDAGFTLGEKAAIALAVLGQGVSLWGMAAYLWRTLVG